MIALLRKFVLAAGCVPLLAMVSPVQAQAPAYPTKPIVIVVGYPPGGGPDISARMMGEKLSARLGQVVLVENRPGVSGLIGASHVARAPADGYTLLLAPNTFLIAPQLLPKDASVKLDVLEDFAPVISPTKGAMVMVAHPSLGVHNAKELVALLKKQPGLAYATPGAGSPMHIAGELFKKSAGVEMLHVPYKGVAPAIADVLGGHVKVSYASIGVVAAHIASGKLVALGLAEKERSALMPDLPTLVEQGYPDTSVGAWYGVFAPKGTPPAVIETLNKEFNAVLQMPETVAKFKTLWETPRGGSAADLAKLSRDEYNNYAKLIKEFKISAE